MGDYSLPKEQRMSGRTAIERLFAEGAGGFVYPLRYVLLVDKEMPAGISVLVNVSKKFHKRAVKRNLLKRRMREAFRTQNEAVKELALQKGARINIALLYSIKEVVEFEKIRDAVGKIFTQVIERV